MNNLCVEKLHYNIIRIDEEKKDKEQVFLKFIGQKRNSEIIDFVNWYLWWFWIIFVIYYYQVSKNFIIIKLTLKKGHEEKFITINVSLDI